MNREYENVEKSVIHELFSDAVSKYPDKTALQIKRDSGWKKLSYQQAEDLSKKAAAFLIKQELNKGGRAVLVLENCPEWPVIYLGIARAGLVCVPLDPHLEQGELENLINDCSAKVIFISQELLPKLSQGIINSVKKIVVLNYSGGVKNNFINFSQIKNTSLEGVNWPKVSPDDTASLIYTSGTTAEPKGVVLTHLNFCSNFKSIDSLDLCSCRDNILAILPLYHTYSFMVTMLIPLFKGAVITYCLSFNPRDLISIIKETKVTIFPGVPQVFSSMYKGIFSKVKNVPRILIPFFIPILKLKVKRLFGKNLRLFVSGGARLEPQIGKGLNYFAEFVEGYGLTETSPIVTLNPPRKQKFGSVGKPVPDVEVKIISPDSQGVGEAAIKGPNVMQGYFNDPCLTGHVIKEGWFYSGDLGYLDKDGYLFLTGRKKDVIVLSSGKKVYPEELEEYYLKSPYIKEICVFSKREEKFGGYVESLYAVIVPNLDYFREKHQADIREKILWELNRLSCQMPSYRRVKGFTLSRQDLPHTSLNKIQRYKVKEKYLEEISIPEPKERAVSPQDSEILQTKAARDIIAYLNKEFKRKVSLDDHLEIDLGIDSLGRVELSFKLEEFLKAEIPDEVINNAATVRELIINVQRVISGEEDFSSLPRDEEPYWPKILSQPPSQNTLNKIRINISFVDSVLTFIFKYIFLFIFKILWPLKIEGRENLPKSGPYIICSNHASYLDGFILFRSLPFEIEKNIFFIGFADIFEKPFVAWVVKSARLISIDSRQYLTEALSAASFVLKHKKIVCIFPEGGRYSTEEIGEFKKGAGILSKELNVSIVPARISGTYQSWPVTRVFPKIFPVKIVFGKPVSWQELGRDYQDITQELRKKVEELGS